MRSVASRTRGHALDQQALAALTGLDGRAALAPATDQNRRVESQTRFLPDRPVAAMTALAQDRLHVPQVIDALGRQWRTREQHQTDNRDHFDFHRNSPHRSRCHIFALYRDRVAPLSSGSYAPQESGVKQLVNNERRHIDGRVAGARAHMRTGIVRDGVIFGE